MTTSNRSRDAIEFEKLGLETRELALKVKELERPEYAKSTFWLSVAATVIAVIGVVGQGVWSGIKNDRAELKIEKAAKTEAEAKARVSDADLRAAQAQSRLENANTRLNAAHAQADAAEERLRVALTAEAEVKTRLASARDQVVAARAAIGKVVQLDAAFPTPVVADTISGLHRDLEAILQKLGAKLFDTSIRPADPAMSSEKQFMREMVFETTPPGATVITISQSAFAVPGVNSPIEFPPVSGRMLPRATPVRGEFVPGNYVAIFHLGGTRSIVPFTVP